MKKFWNKIFYGFYWSEIRFFALFDKINIIHLFIVKPYIKMDEKKKDMLGNIGKLDLITNPDSGYGIAFAQYCMLMLGSIATFPVLFGFALLLIKDSGTAVVSAGAFAYISGILFHYIFSTKRKYYLKMFKEFSLYTNKQKFKLQILSYALMIGSAIWAWSLITISLSYYYK